MTQLYTKQEICALQYRCAFTGRTLSFRYVRCIRNNKPGEKRVASTMRGRWQATKPHQSARGSSGSSGGGGLLSSGDRGQQTKLVTLVQNLSQQWKERKLVKTALGMEGPSEKVWEPFCEIKKVICST